MLTLCWGLNWPVMKLGISGFPPLSFRTLSMWLGLPLDGKLTSSETWRLYLVAPETGSHLNVAWPSTVSPVSGATGTGGVVCLRKAGCAF